MKLLSVKFSFVGAFVIWDWTPHDHDGKRYNYYVRVVSGGVKSAFHSNQNANKSNSLDLIKLTKA